MKILFLLLPVAFASAQETTPAMAQTKPALIEGLVRAAGDGPPLADLDVSAGRIETKTDAAGRYTLRAVPPGRHQVIVGRIRSAASGSKMVALGPGQTVTADFALPLSGTISGRVRDENDEVVPGVEVALISREYVAGALRYFRRNVARTDDEGEYRMQFVHPGVAYLLLFRKTDGRKMSAVSESPSEPKLRRPTLAPTYYPGVPVPEGATPVILRGGEHREEVNVRLLRAPSFCVEGMLTDAGRPAAMTFQIEESHLSFGIGPSGGVTGLPLSGDAGADGRFRICDLHPGEYRLAAFTGDLNRPDSMRTIPVYIRDRDEQNVTLQPVPRLAPLAIEFMWSGDPPEKPVESKLGLFLQSSSRSFGAFAGVSPVSLPGRSELRDLLLDDYYARVTGLNGRLYLKEILYGNENITYAPLHAGAAASGTSLVVRIGHDGVQINIRTTDRDGNVIPHATVVVMPSVFSSDGELAARSMAGQTDQNGDYMSRALMPGKYLVVAMKEPFAEWNPEFVAKIRAVRNQASEISLDANATAEMKLVLATVP